MDRTSKIIYIIVSVSFLGMILFNVLTPIIGIQKSIAKFTPMLTGFSGIMSDEIYRDLVSINGESFENYSEEEIADHVAKVLDNLSNQGFKYNIDNVKHTIRIFSEEKDYDLFIQGYSIEEDLPMSITLKKNGQTYHIEETKHD